VLAHLHERQESVEERIITFACRIVVYVGSMGNLLRSTISQVYRDVKQRQFIVAYGIPIPAHFSEKSNVGYLFLLLTLMIMCILEPIFWCAPNMDGDFEGGGLFTVHCPEAAGTKDVYCTASMIAMLIYWFLLLDLSIFSMRLSSFILVCGRVLPEVFLFLLGFGSVIIAFATAINCLTERPDSFSGIPQNALVLFSIGLGMFPSSKFEQIQENPAVLAMTSAFVGFTLVFLLNLLIAQLVVAYSQAAANMDGYARLSRTGIVVSTIESIPKSKWSKFLSGLNLDERLEFNEGDVGVAGGIQIMEPANLNPVTKDSIRRFGGSTSAALPWAEEGEQVDNKYDKLEKMLVRATKNMGSKGSSRKGAGDSSNGTSSLNGSSHSAGSE